MGDWHCTRCGLCCTEFDMFCPDPAARRFMEMHGLECTDTADGRIRMTYRAMCDNLSFVDGIATCADYENRPAICRNYTCEGRR